MDEENSLQFDASSSGPSSDRASSTLDTITADSTGHPSPLLPDSTLPSDSDQHLDHHSSEEELEVINGRHPEKRKWHQANRLSSRSSDDEVRDLMCNSAPVEFRSSPPANVPKPSRSLSPPPKLFHHSAGSGITPHELCAVSPRKRHRRGGLPASTTTTGLVVEHRPCLDFEKMQQVGRPRFLLPRMCCCFVYLVLLRSG